MNAARSLRVEDSGAARAKRQLGTARKPAACVRSLLDVLNDVHDFDAPGWDACRDECLIDLTTIQQIVSDKPKDAEGQMLACKDAALRLASKQFDGGTMRRITSDQIEIDGRFQTEADDGRIVQHAPKAIRCYIDARRALRLLWLSQEPRAVRRCADPGTDDAGDNGGPCIRFGYRSDFCDVHRNDDAARKRRARRPRRL